MDDIERFFSPKSIAVAGASRNPQKLGYVILDNLQRARYRGELYPVNPHGERILGLTTYPTMLDLPATPDLAVLTVPVRAVAEVLEQCGRRGVRAAVIVTAGFRETGPQGCEAEDELLAVARRYGIRLVGPNSVGIINTAVGMNATFAETVPFQYEVSMFSQSGAVATAILDWARSINVGFSKFVSLGNMADLNEVDFLEYLGRDPETKLIVGYLEGISDGRRLMEAARRVTPEKPVILMKVGATAAGARAARSHTGALASSEAIVDAAFRQAGIIRATTMAEFFDQVLCFSYAPLPRGPRVAIVTNAGGPGVMAADALEGFGLEAAQLSPGTLDAVAKALPSAAATANPIDVLGDAGSDRYQTALELVRDDPSVDAVLALLTPQRVTEPERTARVISYLAREQSKPLLAVFMGGDAVSRARTMLDEARVPVYAYPERAVRALAALVRYSRYRQDVLSEAT
jgi:acetyl coenzyme A synthetase (ADP forming)-like protein